MDRVEAQTGSHHSLLLGLIGGILILASAGQCGGNTRSAAPSPASSALNDVIETSTLRGKVMCGYQGWFNCEGDGMGRGWGHYMWNGFGPGNCCIDMWPDVSELDEDEKYPTPFRHADGTTASLFSSANRKTVLRHFRWMRDYGIDGVFLQRFPVDFVHPRALRHHNNSLRLCQEGANASGRVYALMYDLSLLGPDAVQIVRDDWKMLVDSMGLTRSTTDTSYLHHNGRPVVAVWGIGFNDDRKYSLDHCGEILDFLKHDPVYGGNTVMIGVPAWWREGKRDAVDDPELQRIVLKADIISPWSVGRFQNIEEVEVFARDVWQPDMHWCRQNGKEYLPVVFPGFSWHNMKPDAPFDAIPRRKGQFLWKQYVEAIEGGATMIYQAMFDEMNEGTAIFKCTNNPPVGASRFVTYEGLPSDHYLWLVGTAGRMLRGELPRQSEIPTRDR